jgi:hypothetical protein
VIRGNGADGGCGRVPLRLGPAHGRGQVRLAKRLPPSDPLVPGDEALVCAVSIGAAFRGAKLPGRIRTTFIATTPLPGNPDGRKKDI